MKTQVSRRDFLGRGLVVSAGLCSGSAGLGAESLATPATAGQVQPNSKGTVPAGRIGEFRFSRLISGGNLLSGWCHQRFAEGAVLAGVRFAPAPRVDSDSRSARELVVASLPRRV